MKFRNLRNWKNLEQTKGLLYFVQRCEELTFCYTLDSHKSSTTSIQGLVFEALSVLENAAAAPDNRKESAKKSVVQILNELNLRLASNWVAKKCLSVGLEEVSRLSVAESSIDEFKRCLEVIAAELDGHQYISEIVDQVMLLASNSNEKQKLDILAREFVATLQGLSVSRDHINDGVVNFFYRGEDIVDPKCLKEFCRMVYPHRHEYSVAVGVSPEIKNVDTENLAAAGILLLDENSENVGVERGTREGLQKELNAQDVVLVKVGATDYNSAVTNAASVLDDIGNFYKIFSHKSEFHTSEIAVAIQACCDGVSKTIEVSGNHMHYIRDMRSKEASRNFRKFKDDISLDVGPDKNKFRNVVNIHGMSLSSGSSDIQLVNIWTCLETIAPSKGNHSNADAVVAALLPAIMLTYIDRLVTNLLFDILNWDRRTLWRTLKEAKLDHIEDLRSKFIYLLSNTEAEPALKGLLGRFKDFELLRYRTYLIATLLRDKKQIKDRIDRHERLVRWQIYRIYRTRNSIVHLGDSPNFTGYLVENAHDFFDICFRFCMQLSAAKNGYNSFESCFDFAEASYKKYYKDLENCDAIDLAWSLPKRKGRNFIFDQD